jgi:nucleotide-binding universal stress UspA family protein
MNENKPVIVTTDGSAHSHRVIPHAALLSTALDAPLLVLQVQDASQLDGVRAESDATSTLDRLGIAGDVLIEESQPGEKTADTILRVVRQRGAVALAIDSRGHGALRHALHGSVALDVLKAAELPLLVSGPSLDLPDSEASTYRVVATSDGSRASEALLNGLGAWDAAIEVLLLRVHEHEPGGQDDEAAMRTCQDELEAVRRLLPASMSVQTAVREIPRGGGIDTAIVEEAAKFNAHAIAMSTHGHSARRHVVMGSVALTLLGRSPLPLLLVRAEL